MIKIGICDDDNKMCKTLKEYIFRLIQEKQNRVKIEIFENGQQLLQNYPKDMDILLLDIELGDWNGVELAHKLRQVDQKVQIIFITNMPQFAVGGYKVRAFGYLVKPVSYEQFSMELKELLELIASTRGAVIALKCGSELVQIRVEQLYYVETKGRKLLLHAKEQNYEVSCSMTALEKMPELARFVRCHTGYLVNSGQILKISGNSLVMNNGDEIPISKHRRAKCVQELGRYWGGSL